MVYCKSNWWSGDGRRRMELRRDRDEIGVKNDWNLNRINRRIR